MQFDGDTESRQMPCESGADDLPFKLSVAASEHGYGQ